MIGSPAQSLITTASDRDGAPSRPAHARPMRGSDATPEKFLRRQAAHCASGPALSITHRDLLHLSSPGAAV